jgi:hypothetical protein
MPDLAVALAASGPAGEAKRWIARAGRHVARLLRSRRTGTYEQAVLDRLEGGLPSVKAHGGDAGPLSERERTVVRREAITEARRLGVL